MHDRPPRLTAHDTALFLDIDGTVAELAATPGEVVAEPRRTAILRRVAERLGGRVAVLSGRSLGDVDRILDAAIGPVAALHGLAHRHADGAVEAAPHCPGLQPARDALEAFVSGRPELLLEDKELSLALHYRTCPDAADEVEVLARRISEDCGLRLQPGSMVMELRAPGPDKGDALRRFMRTPAFEGRRPVMVGDDLTDEVAFEAAADAGGFGVLVGPPRRTHARYRLASVPDVLDWISQT